jgi:hypothetical protein
LRKAIIHGSGQSLSGIGEPVTIASAAAAITAATPVLIAAKKLMKELGVIKDKSSEDVDTETAIDEEEDKHDSTGRPPFMAQFNPATISTILISKGDPPPPTSGQGNLFQDSSALSFALKFFILALVMLHLADIQNYISAVAVGITAAVVKVVHLKLKAR